MTVPCNLGKLLLFKKKFLSHDPAFTDVFYMVFILSARHWSAGRNIPTLLLFNIYTNVKLVPSMFVSLVQDVTCPREEVSSSDL